MTALLLPNAELVACAWVGAILDPSMVGTTLPDDNTSWATSGFVQVNGVGGTPNIYVPTRASVLGLQFWAVAPSSTKPPWGKAANLAETVLAATYDRARMGLTVTLPGGFPAAVVQTAYPLGDPVRVPGDPANYARYVLDIQIHWKPLS